MSEFNIHNQETAPAAAKALSLQTDQALGFIPNLLAVMA